MHFWAKQIIYNSVQVHKNGRMTQINLGTDVFCIRWRDITAPPLTSLRQSFWRHSMNVRSTSPRPGPGFQTNSMGHNKYNTGAISRKGGKLPNIQRSAATDELYILGSVGRPFSFSYPSPSSNGSMIKNYIQQKKAISASVLKPRAVSVLKFGVG